MIEFIQIYRFQYQYSIFRLSLSTMQYTIQFFFLIFKKIVYHLIIHFQFQCFLITACGQSDDKRIEKTWLNRRGITTNYVGTSFFFYTCQSKVIFTLIYYLESFFIKHRLTKFYFFWNIYYNSKLIMQKLIFLFFK